MEPEAFGKKTPFRKFCFKVAALIFLLGSIYNFIPQSRVYFKKAESGLKSFLKSDNHTSTNKTSSSIFADAYKNHKSNIQVNGTGTIIKLLSDDNKGTKHQRFIIKLPSRQTLLIAHNIDIAPKIFNLKIGTTIEFCGEYEWNVKGGVVHWTHHDPRKHHKTGYLKYNGKMYK